MNRETSCFSTDGCPKYFLMWYGKELPEQAYYEINKLYMKSGGGVRYERDKNELIWCEAMLEYIEKNGL